MRVCAGRGKLTREVVEAAGYGPKWVREVARRYNEQGPEGLSDRRPRNPDGADRALLDDYRREELKATLALEAAGDGRLWSGCKVALWI